ncbi:MAG: lipase maturation factor family protein, partial [Planctomycetota bacterium]|nr:lipase maturation factor family protein [Planctomycetota bacterium]
RRPRQVAPHQPRLDWQMWFAALGNYRSPRNRWFIQLERRLLEGSPEVLGLFKFNPFPDEPPRYIRAILYDYHFTDWKTKTEEGTWWTRERIRAYTPILSLESFRRR